MFKKATAIVLSLALLVVGAFVAPIASAEGPTQWTQDFEDYGASVSNDTMTVIERPENVPQRSGSSGTKVAHASAAGSSTQRMHLSPLDTTKKLSAETTYRVSFWVYCVTKPTAFLLKETNNSNAEVGGAQLCVTYSIPAVNQWKQITLTFTTTSSANKFIAFNAWTPATGAEFYIDDVVVTEVVESTISFESNGGSTVDSITGEYGSAITMPSNPTKADNDFVGWYTDETLETEFSLTTFPATNITLYAKWLSQTTLSFNTNGGSVVDTIKGAVGSAITMPTNPTKADYVFVGWYTDSALTQKFAATTFPETDTTLYAKWREIGVFEQGFEEDGFNISTTNLSVYTKQSEEDTLVHTGEKSLYKAATANSYISPFAYATPAEKLVVGKKYRISMWVYVPQKIVSTAAGHWSVKYLDDKDNAFSYSSNPDTHHIKYFNESFAVGEWTQVSLDFTAALNKYLGLYTYGGFEMYIDDITLTEVKQSTITFNTNGGSAVDALTGEIGTTITLPEAPTKADHTFDGWYTDADLTQEFTATEYPESNITLYAKWTKVSYIETAHNQKAAMLKADAAPNGKQGIRIYNKIDKNFVEENVNEFGSIVIREGFLKSVYKYVNGSELTLNTTADIENSFTIDLRDAYAAKDSKYATAPGYGLGAAFDKNDAENAKLWGEDDKAYEFTAFIVGIEPKYYDDIYFIRSYAKTNEGVVYGNVQELCIYDQVYAILNADDATETDIDAANAVVAQANAAAATDDSVVTYADWLSTKNAQ